MTKNKDTQKPVGYPIGDFLVRIKNVVRAKRHSVEVKNTKIIEAMAKVLKEEGYLSEITKSGSILSVSVAYRKKEPLILDINLVSKPGLRVYMGASELKKIRGPRRLILSTPKGIMFHREAIKKNLGGEIIANLL